MAWWIRPMVHQVQGYQTCRLDKAHEQLVISYFSLWLLPHPISCFFSGAMCSFPSVEQGEEKKTYKASFLCWIGWGLLPLLYSIGWVLLPSSFGGEREGQEKSQRERGSSVAPLRPTKLYSRHKQLHPHLVDLLNSIPSFKAEISNSVLRLLKSWLVLRIRMGTNHLIN